MASSKKTKDAASIESDTRPQDSVEHESPKGPDNPKTSPECTATGAGAEPVAGPQTAGSSGAIGVVGFDAFVASNETILDSIAALNGEVTAFGGQRLDANLRHRDRLIDCHSPEEVFRLQGEFINTAVRDYLEQTNHVMKIMSDMTLNCWSAHGSQSKEVLSNLGKESLS